MKNEQKISAEKKVTSTLKLAARENLARCSASRICACGRSACEEKKKMRGGIKALNLARCQDDLFFCSFQLSLWQDDLRAVPTRAVPTRAVPTRAVPALAGDPPVGVCVCVCVYTDFIYVSINVCVNALSLSLSLSLSRSLSLSNICTHIALTHIP